MKLTLHTTRVAIKQDDYQTQGEWVESPHSTATLNYRYSPGSLSIQGKPGFNPRSRQPYDILYHLGGADYRGNLQSVLASLRNKRTMVDRFIQELENLDEGEVLQYVSQALSKKAQPDNA
jgi:hypothetical protein